MSETIGKLYAELKADVDEMSKKVYEKQKLMDALRAQCAHKWEWSHECYHKREDYYKCVWCEEQR